MFLGIIIGIAIGAAFSPFWMKVYATGKTLLAKNSAKSE